jgi:hypothetical protein
MSKRKHDSKPDIVEEKIPHHETSVGKCEDAVKWIEVRRKLSIIDAAKAKGISTSMLNR